MLDAYRRRRRDELAALGVAVNAAVGDPKKLQKNLEKAIPDLDKPRSPQVKNPDKPWWTQTEGGVH